MRLAHYMTAGGRGILLAAVCFGSAVTAQQVPPVSGFMTEMPQSLVLTVDTERLFSESLFGKRKAAELTAATEELAQENRRIEGDLLSEEQSLTQRRPSMALDDFRAAADAFDARVQAFRSAQDAKEMALQQSLTAGRDAFLQAAAPVLGEMMRAAGASVVLDRRTVFLALGNVDITDEAIAAIDARIGDGLAEEEAFAAEMEALQDRTAP